MRLSICIPTYNRREHLRALLDDLTGELSTVPEAGQFEVCVIDNASTDGSGQMLDDYARRYSRVRVAHNPVNVGMEGNIINALLAGRGEYTWLLSDHQRIRPRVVGECLELIGRHQPDLVCMAIEQWGRPLRAAGPPLAYGALTPAERGALIFTIGNMSAMLVRTALFRTTIADSYRIARFNYPHLAVISSFRETTQVAEIGAASRFGDTPGVPAARRTYDTFGASFINNLKCVRELLVRPETAISVAAFQTPVYKKALGGELARIMITGRAPRGEVAGQLGRAWAANYCFPFGGVCSWWIGVAMLAYLLPFSLRRFLGIKLLSAIRPDSLLLGDRGAAAS